MSHEQISAALLEEQHARIHSELYDSVLPFWMKNSLDQEHGGYFNCLDRDGTPYDTKKHVWLQGRQVWMLSRLHNTLHGPGQSSEYLEAAKLGMDFLRKHARKDRRVYFCLTREGLPCAIQRKMFSECFYVMALAEYSRASGDDSARAEAREMLDIVIDYAKNPSQLGRPVFDHLPAESHLAIPMILLNLIDVVADPGETTWEELAEWCVRKIHLHIRPELNLVLEHVGADGRLIDSPEGRLVNPGHAIECAWFLLDHARTKGNDALVRSCLNMLEWSYDFGWDEEFGGLFYFLDREGYSPLQLEWNMKLWWPHSEAMIAFLKAFEATGDNKFLHKFLHITDYTFKHFSDPEHGEWYGYLDRRGDVAMRFKGGPYKGCFHTPRALLYCERILARMIGKA